MKDFHKAAESMKNTKEQNCAMKNLQWSGPPVGVIKVNWDAAIDSSNKKISVRAIVRDH